MPAPQSSATPPRKSSVTPPRKSSATPPRKSSVTPARPQLRHPRAPKLRHTRACRGYLAVPSTKPRTHPGHLPTPTNTYQTRPRPNPPDQIRTPPPPTPTPSHPHPTAPSPPRPTAPSPPRPQLRHTRACRGYLAAPSTKPPTHPGHLPTPTKPDHAPTPQPAEHPWTRLNKPERFPNTPHPLPTPDQIGPPPPPHPPHQNSAVQLNTPTTHAPQRRKAGKREHTRGTVRYPRQARV